jgi:hypothetical protein
MQRICSGVKANVESGLALVNHLGDFLLVGNLSNQATGFEFFIASHSISLLNM